MAKSPAGHAGDTRTVDSVPGQEDPLEERATHSSIPASKIPQRSLVGYSPWAPKHKTRRGKITRGLKQKSSRNTDD